MYFISKSKFAPYESQGTLVEEKKKKEPCVYSSRRALKA